MDLTPSGKPKLGYSYPSNQRRAGPAPLASFEDLPSDEQISPEGDGDENTLKDLSPGPEEFDHILSFDSRDVLTQPSPNKVTIPKQQATNGHSTCHEDNLNGFSVIQQNVRLLSTTPKNVDQEQGWPPTNVTADKSQICADQETASGEVTPTGYSSPLIPCGSGVGNDGSFARSSTLMVPSGDESGGEKSPSPDSRRKGSWTDIFFRGRSRSRSKSPIGSECSQKSPNCDQEKTTITTTPTTASSGTGKTKKGFFSFLKVGRKSASPSQSGQSKVQKSSSPANPSATPASVSDNPSQANECIASSEGENKCVNYCESKITSHPLFAVGNVDKLGEESIVSPGLNEPKESQQDMINKIERTIEEKMCNLDGNIQLDLPPNLQFHELISSTHTKSSAINTSNQESERTIESSSETESSLDPTINNNPMSAPSLAGKSRTRPETVDDDCQSLPRSFKTKGGDLIVNKRGAETTVVATIEHNSSEKGYSSESDLEESSATLHAEISGKKATYFKHQSSEISENDFEAATLLSHDSIDYDDYDSPTELVVTPEVEEKLARESSSRTSARRRLDVNTIPVDRPRSTTPINIAPLEAFLSTASLSPDPNVEKIRLSLPSDTFTNNNNNHLFRAKSPRKSNPAIWLEFCEKGLHSPKNFHRRRLSNYEKTSSTNDSINTNAIAGTGSLGINLTNSTVDAFTPVMETPSQAVSPLTPITPLDFEDQWTPFGDNFNPYAFIKENIEHTVERYKWSMECDKCDCLIGKLGSFNSNDPSGDNTPVKDQITPMSPRELSEMKDEQPLLSPIACSCDCHHAIPIVCSNGSNSQTNKGQEALFSISSDISSASSRLIQASSASTSKSSSVGEVEDKM